MKTFIALLFIFSFTSIYSQTNFTLKWESPFNDRGFVGISNCEKGNNIPELVFKSNTGNTYYIYDGNTKQLKYTLPLSDSETINTYNLYSNVIPNLPIDLNNDNIYEVISIRPYTLKVLNGQNGALLHLFNWSGYVINSNIYTVDIDGDGYIEILISRTLPVNPNSYILDIYSTTAQAIGILGNQNNVTDFKLKQNYPNPFNPVTKIEYSVSKKSNVGIKLYDILGREVRTLLNESKPEGNYTLELDASDLSSGTYFYQITVNDFTDAKKMVLIK